MAAKRVLHYDEQLESIQHILGKQTAMEFTARQRRHTLSEEGGTQLNANQREVCKLLQHHEAELRLLHTCETFKPQASVLNAQRREEMEPPDLAKGKPVDLRFASQQKSRNVT